MPGRHLKRLMSEGIPLWLFGILVSVVYCSTVLPVEFRSVPVDGMYSLAVTSFQFGIVAFCTFGLLLLMSAFRWVFAVLFPALAVVSGVMCFFNITIGTTLTPVAIEIAVINDASMWWSMVSVGLVAVIALSLGAGVLAVVCRFRYVRASRKSSAAAFLAGLAIVLLPTVLVRRISAPVGGRLPYSIYFSLRDFAVNRQNVATVRDNFAGERAVAADNSPDVIFVLGESLRADHLPMNGYHRNTMPNLSAMDNLVSFTDIYSEATFTDTSVPRLLTRADAREPGRAYTEQSFITLFKNAGYETAWFANQDLSKSYTYFAHEADTLVYCNAGRSFYSYEKWLDADMLPAIADWLGRERGKRKLAVVHTIGSHWWYKSHYTESQARFKPEVTHKDVGGLTVGQMINSYDNTIIATDGFLRDLYGMVRDRNAVIFFVSDHGEGLGEEGVFLHASDTPPLHRPACFVIFTPRFEALFPGKAGALRRNRNLADSTDAVFHTVLDLAAIETNVASPSKSLTRNAKN